MCQGFLFSTRPETVTLHHSEEAFLAAQILFGEAVWIIIIFVILHRWLRYLERWAFVLGGWRLGGGERSISPASRCLQRSWIRSFVSSCSQVIQSRLALLGRGDWACRSRSPLCARYQLLRFYLLPPPGPARPLHPLPFLLREDGKASTLFYPPPTPPYIT